MSPSRGRLFPSPQSRLCPENLSKDLLSVPRPLSVSYTWRHLEVIPGDWPFHSAGVLEPQSPSLVALPLSTHSVLCALVRGPLRRCLFPWRQETQVNVGGRSFPERGELGSCSRTPGTPLPLALPPPRPRDKSAPLRLGLSPTVQGQSPEKGRPAVPREGTPLRKPKAGQRFPPPRKGGSLRGPGPEDPPAWIVLGNSCSSLGWCFQGSSLVSRFALLPLPVPTQPDFRV